VDEVPDVVELVSRQDVRQAARVAADVGGDRRQLRDQPDPLQVAVFGIGDVLRVGIEGRERPDGTEQHSHRVRVVAEALEALRHAAVFRKAGSYESSLRSSVARIAPSAIDTVYSSPVRLSTMVSVSSATG